MDRDRWQRIAALFEGGSELPEENREAWVRTQAAGDTELAEAVLRMLRHDGTENLLDRPLETLAASLIETPPESEVVLSPGQQLGDYEILGILGRGGMGLVYRARDIRLDRLAALKFLPAAANGSDVAAIEAEARAASALDHPNIATIYHIGVADDGRPFIAMAYYEGETLEERLAGGLLKPAEALPIGAAIAAGLAAAHQRGIVHRDVKPANIFLTRDGGVKLLDFGIAAAAGDQPQASGRGTLLYMSPEQGRATAPDPRSDVWSLGAVLFEMLAGRPPFEGGSRHEIQARKSAAEAAPLLPDGRGITRALRRVVARALSLHPDQRYSDGAALLVAIERARRHASRIWVRRPWSAGLLALGAAALGVIGWRLSEAATPDGPPVEILLADVKNATGDSLFPGPALAFAAAVGLQESRQLQLFPRGRVHEILGRMGRSGADTSLDETLAQEIAERANLDAVLVLEAHRADAGYLLSLRVLESSSGRELRTAQVQVAGRKELLDGLDRLLRQVRRSFGETRQQLAERGAELPQVTTASLDALEAYAEGRRAWQRREFEAARLHYDRAVLLDSTFAMALAALADWWFVRANNMVQGESYLTRALAHSDRLSPREQIALRGAAGRYRGRPDEALTAARVLAEQYPSRDAWFSLGTQLMRLQRCVEAIPVMQRALALDSTFVNGWINLATCYQIQDQPALALEAYGHADRLDSTALRRGNLNQEWGRVFVRLGRPAEAESVFRDMLALGDPVERARGNRSLGFLRMYQGRYGDAITHFREAASWGSQTGTSVSELRNRTLLAEALLTAGRRIEARKELDRVHALLERIHPDPPFAFYVGHGWLRIGRTDRARQLLDRLEKEARPGDLFDQSALRLFRGFLALAERRPREALDATADDRHEPFAGYRLAARADAYASLGLVDSALAASQQLMAGFHFGFDSQDQWLRGPLRVGRLAETLGDSALARAAYSGYVDRWREGDSSLAELSFARTRLDGLQRASPR